MKFWTIEEDNTLSSVEGNLVDNENDKFGSIVSDGSKYYVSTRNGSICIWENKEFVSSKLIHSNAIDALFLNDNVLVSGGRDKTVVIMNKELNELNHFEIDGISFNSADPSPRSIDIYGNTTDKILIGTIASDIVEIEFKNGNYLSESTRYKCYLNAHFSTSSKMNNQVTGIAYFKPRNIFITTGEDSSMRFWSATHNKHEDVLAFEHKPCALTISPNYKHIIAAFESGKIQVYDGKDFENPQEFVTYSNKPITALQVSPNNKYLACACVNKNNKHEIIIYKEESEQYEVYTTFTEHNDEVIAIDWTKNSNYIACSSLQGEATIYDINKQTKVEDGSINNSDWVSWTQTSGWALNGYYESGNAHVTACMRSESKVAGHNVIAVGNEDGVVRLYNYPIVSSSQAHIEGDIKHVGKVKRVCFDEESKVVFTAGEEGILFKWVIEEEMNNH
jgi:WD40 repeat protein